MISRSETFVREYWFDWMLTEWILKERGLLTAMTVLCQLSGSIDFAASFVDAGVKPSQGKTTAS